MTVPGARMASAAEGPIEYPADGLSSATAADDGFNAPNGGVEPVGDVLAGRPIPPAAPRGGIRKYLARGGWGITDQALSSTANFVLSVVIARHVGIREFGAFGIAFTAYVLALGLGRACGSLPMLILHPGTDTDQRRAEAAAVGFELLVGFAAGAVCALAGLLTVAPVNGAMFAIALSLPALVMQDSWRFVFFRRLRPSGAALNDGLWALVAVAGSMAIGASPARHNLFAYLISWGVAGVVASVFGCWQAKVFNVISHFREHFRQSRDMLGNLIGEFAATVGVRQASLYVVVAGSSLAGAGAFRAGQTLIGPINIFTQGLTPLLLVEAIAVRRRRPGRLRPFLACAGIGLALAPALYALAMAFLPDNVGHHVLGASWASGRELLLPLALGLALGMPSVAAQTGLRALADTRRAFYLRLMVGIPTLAGAIIGVVVAGVSGAAWGIVIAGAVGVVVSWSYFEVSLRKLPLMRSALLQAGQTGFLAQADGRQREAGKP